MGLAAPKNRSKISTDPNNTAWSRNTSRFGHRILEKQGWTLGSYLGAEDAAHKSHYSAASASHIRILLKDDNLGLGAKRGRDANAETFGLDAFAGVLGRLNGKSEEVVQREQRKREDVRRQMYVGKRWGTLNFVYGGLLVGDKIEEKPAVLVLKASKDSKPAAVADDPEITKKCSKKEKKRKRDAEEAEEESSKSKKKRSKEESKVASEMEVSSKESKKSKKKRKTEKSSMSAATTAEPSRESSVAITDEKAEKKAKEAAKEAKRLESAGKAVIETAESTPVASAPTSSDERSDKKKRKLEKQQRKEARRLKKEQRKLEKAAKSSNTTPVETPAESADPSESESDSTPAPAAARPVAAFRGRQAVRHRYIQQKKMATMDAAALKQIFMIKAQS